MNVILLRKTNKKKFEWLPTRCGQGSLQSWKVFRISSMYRCWFWCFTAARYKCFVQCSELANMTSIFLVSPSENAVGIRHIHLLKTTLLTCSFLGSSIMVRKDVNFYSTLFRGPQQGTHLIYLKNSPSLPIFEIRNQELAGCIDFAGIMVFCGSQLTASTKIGKVNIYQRGLSDFYWTWLLIQNLNGPNVFWSPLVHMLEPLQAQRKRVRTWQQISSKKGHGKNGKAVEAGGQHWCNRWEQQWELT